MVDYPVSRQGLGFDIDDFATLSFDATEKSYTVGSNQRAINPDYWPENVEAQQVLFLATEDCYVRFNRADAVRHLIPAGNFILFPRRVLVFYYIRAGAANGTLYAWMFG